MFLVIYVWISVWIIIYFTNQATEKYSAVPRKKSFAERQKNYAEKKEKKSIVQLCSTRLVTFQS